MVTEKDINKYAPPSKKKEAKEHIRRRGGGGRGGRSRGGGRGSRPSQPQQPSKYYRDPKTGKTYTSPGAGRVPTDKPTRQTPSRRVVQPPGTVTRSRKGGGTITVTKGGKVTERTAEGKLIQQYQAPRGAAGKWVTREAGTISQQRSMIRHAQVTAQDQYAGLREKVPSVKLAELEPSRQQAIKDTGVEFSPGLYQKMYKQRGQLEPIYKKEFREFTGFQANVSPGLRRKYIEQQIPEVIRKERIQIKLTELQKKQEISGGFPLYFEKTGDVERKLRVGATGLQEGYIKGTEDLELGKAPLLERLGFMAGKKVKKTKETTRYKQIVSWIEQKGKEIDIQPAKWVMPTSVPKYVQLSKKSIEFWKTHAMPEEGVASLERDISTLGVALAKRQERYKVSYPGKTTEQITAETRTTFDFIGGTLGGALRGVRERSEERRVGKECRSRWSPYH